MSADCHETFLPCGGPQHLIPRSPENRGGQKENIRVVISDEYFGCIIYKLLPSI